MMKMETCKSCRGSNFGGFKFFSCLASLATIEKSQLAVGKVTFLPKEQRKIFIFKAEGSQINKEIKSGSCPPEH